MTATEQTSVDEMASGNAPEGPVAALGAAAGAAALLSAAACCVVPLALAAIGVGASGLSAIVPLHRPLTVVGVVSVAAGWLLYYRRARACARTASCPTVTLALATAAVGLSAGWGYIEAPLMRLLGGA